MFCSKCGTSLCSAGNSVAYCELCGNFSDTSEQGSAPLQQKSELPWENINTVGFFKALYLTLYKSTCYPSLFFASITGKTSLLYSILYALILGSIGITFTSLWQSCCADLFTSLASASGLSTDSSAGINPQSLLFSPISSIAAVVFIGLYVHLFLTIFRNKHASFRATLSTVCYAQSASIFLLLPFIGQFLSLFWGLYLLVCGLGKVHSISKTKAATTIFLPVLFIVSFLFFILLIVFLVSGTLLTGTYFKELLPFFR